MKKLLLALPLLAVAACDAQAQRSDAEIGEVVKNYLMENPNVIIESVEKYQEQQYLEAQKASGEKLSELLPTILETGPFIGNADAENVVVEFFDYNCGYCKRAVGNIAKLHSEFADTKIVFKELPILSPGSEMLARAALVVHKKQPAKYFEFHTALMENKKPASPKTLVEIAAKLGLSDIDFETEMKAEDISKEIETNRDVSAKVGIQGTPAFIVNGELVRGAVPYEELVKALGK